MPHLDDGTLQELIDGEIPSSSLSPITEHLAGCARCRDRLAVAQANLAEADALVEMLDDDVAVPTVTASGPVVSRVRQWPLRLAWAASLVIAVGTGYGARGAIRPDGIPLSNVAERQPAEDDLQRPPADTTTPAPQSPAYSRPEAVVTADASRPAAVDRPANRADQAQPTVGAAPAAAPQPAPTIAAPAVTEQRAFARDMLESSGAASVAREGVALSKQAVPPSKPDTISLRDAMQLLGGRLRLVDGLVPVRVESDGAAVRVVYDLGGGELVLTQRVTNGTVTWRLVAPPGVAPDSVARLRAAVHE